MAQPMHFGTGETDMGRNITARILEFSFFVVGGLWGFGGLRLRLSCRML